MSERGTTRQQLAVIWPHVRPDLAWYVVALLAAPGNTALAVLQPWLLKQAIDRGITPADSAMLLQFALGYLAAGVAAFLLEGVYTMAIGVGATRTINTVRDAVYAHALSLAPSFHDREPTGRLLTRVTSDVEALGETLTAGAFTIVLDVLLVVSVLVAMFALDPKLTGVLLLVAPPLGLAIEVFRRRMRVLYVAVRTHLAEMIAFAAERIAGIEVVQLYGDEARVQGMFDARLGSTAAPRSPRTSGTPRCSRSSTASRRSPWR
ncbi:MAG: ABC transporter ATP-binding protein [Myxococcota bacterium]